MDEIKISLTSEECNFISPETMEIINKHNESIETCIRDVALDTVVGILISANIISGRDYYDTILQAMLRDNDEYDKLIERGKIIAEIIDIDKKINKQKRIKRENTTSIIFDENNYRNKFTDELSAYKNSLLRRYNELKSISKENIKVENVTTIVVP